MLWNSFSWEQDFCLQSGFYTLFFLFTPFPKTTVDASSSRTADCIVIPSHPYRSSRVGNCSMCGLIGDIQRKKAK